MIRAATLDDLPRLVMLGAAMHAESTYRDQPFVAEKVANLLGALINGAGVVFVSTRDDVVMGGMAGGVATNWFNDEQVAFEYGLFMSPAARHGMSALKLVSAFDKWLQLKGVKRSRVGITTGVNVDGTAALYRSLGYVDSGVFLTKEF